MSGRSLHAAPEMWAGFRHRAEAFKTVGVPSLPRFLRFSTRRR
jgi:hypothetical protein